MTSFSWKSRHKDFDGYMKTSQKPGIRNSMNTFDLEFKVWWWETQNKIVIFQTFHLSHNHDRFAFWSWKAYSRTKHRLVDSDSNRQLRTIIYPLCKIGQSEPWVFLLGAKNTQNQVFGNINYKETLMQKSLFTLFIYCKILILSIFRANLKNDQKNDINVQFSHPLQTMCTNQSGSKETLYFFFICRNQIFHYQLSFWHIWKKKLKILAFFWKK